MQANLRYGVMPISNLFPPSQDREPIRSLPIVPSCACLANHMGKAGRLVRQVIHLDQFVAIQKAYSHSISSTGNLLYQIVLDAVQQLFQTTVVDIKRLVHNHGMRHTKVECILFNAHAGELSVGSIVMSNHYINECIQSTTNPVKDAMKIRLLEDSNQPNASMSAVSFAV